MIVKDIKPIILRAVDEQFCTTDSIRKYFEKSVQADILADDLRHVLDGMTVENSLVYLSNAAFAAYFRADNPPIKFFRGGGGKTHALYDGKNDGMPLMPITLDYVADFSDDKDVRIFPHFTESELTRIEELTKEQIPNTEIAKELNIDESLFILRTRHDPETRGAIIRGQKHNEMAAAIENIYSRALLGASEEELAKLLNLEIGAFNTLLKKNPLLLDAFKRGRKEYEAANAPKKPVYVIPPEEPEEPRPPRILSRKRLCLCGNPLGARTKECRECFLKTVGRGEKQAASASNANVAHQINEIISLNILEQSELLKIAVEVILACPITAIKQQFYERVSDRVFQSSADSQTETKELTSAN